MLVLHGILGSGSNWRAVVRRALQDRPRWGAILVDLRMHGGSMGFAGPHTLGAASSDLVALGRDLDLHFDLVLGHSFGGKVALWHTRDTLGSARSVVIVDSVPGARPDARASSFVARAIDALESLGTEFATREDFIARLRLRGVSRAVAAWLAMNLSREANGAFALRLDLCAIKEMLGDYFATDLWGVIEEPTGRAKIHLVIAGRSGLFVPEDLARAEALALARPEAVEVHVIPNASHWVNADAPEEMLDVLLTIMD